MFKKILTPFIFSILITQAYAEIISISNDKEISDWGSSCAAHVASYVGEESSSIWSIQGDDKSFNDIFSVIFIKTSDLSDMKFNAKELKLNTNNSYLSVQVKLTAKKLKKGNGWGDDIKQQVVSKAITCEFSNAVRGEGKNKVPSKIVEYYENGNGGISYKRYESSIDCIRNTSKNYPSMYCYNRSFPMIDSEIFDKDGFPAWYGFGE
jgi:hypothetical protein